MLIKPRRVRGAAATKEWDHFSDDMRVRKILLRLLVCNFEPKVQNYARSRLQSFWQKIPQEFSPVVACAGDFSIDNPRPGRVQW